MRLRIVGLALILATTACSKNKPSTPGAGPGNEPSKPVASNLEAFASAEALKTFLDDHAKAKRGEDSLAQAAPSASSAAADSMGGNAPSITNNQTAGVDEGGIVKTHGDHLVVLRRGRLFTVKVGGDSLAPVAAVDAFGPDIDPKGCWYDEMLVTGDTAIVIGYSYARGGTEIGLFDLSNDGAIRYRATYHLRSNDYYSSRNYASRIVGGKLVFYTPSYLTPGSSDPMQAFPAVRKWHKDASKDEFKRILEPTSIYRPDADFGNWALHTVTVCDLGKGKMDCKATAVLGPPGRVFYVAASSIYVWATDWRYAGGKSETRGVLVRMPLDGGAPAAQRVSGSPVDQFSFLERDGHVNVLVRSDAAGDAMWAPEATAGDVAMLRIPVGFFSEKFGDVPKQRYTQLPRPVGWSFQNRFVGDHLIYGTATSPYDGAAPGADKKLFVHDYAHGGEPRTLALEHGVERIEAMGKNAVVVGGDGKALHFTSIALAGEPRAAGHYLREGASQGETRSHGFFYKPDPSGEAGLLGLPIVGSKRSVRRLSEESASVVFVRNESLDLRLIGELEAGQSLGREDGCRASCVDWYGNARPIFLGSRAFALMGYELVEGSLAAGRVTERRRISFAPHRS